MTDVIAPAAPPVPIEWWDHFEPPDSYRAEVIRGELVVAPTPGNEHQYALAAIGAVLQSAIGTAASPELVVLPEAAWQRDGRGIVAQAARPDVMVFRRDDARRQEGTPVLAVEVLSPSDASRLSDGLTRIEGKRSDYATHGLTDYVEIERHRDGFMARRYELVNGMLVAADAVAAGGVLIATRPFRYEFRLADLVL